MDNRLSENVYVLADNKPTKNDADANGNVLYYSPTMGWHQGFWYTTWNSDVTHWTFLPEQPPSQEDPVHKMERRFNAWVTDQFPNVEPAVKMLLRLGYEAGYKGGD